MIDIFYDNQTLNFLFEDFFHFLLYILFISFCLLFKLLDKNLFIFLLVFSPTPFIFNNFFFVSYFPDTTDYLETLLYHRDYVELHPGYLGDKKIINYTYFLSFIPLPFIFSKIALGYFSKFILTLLVIYLFRKNNTNSILFILILLTPELIMYTSLGLKEAVIIFLMTISLIKYESQKYITLLIFLIPIYFIKYQNFYFILIFIFIHQYFKIIKLNYKLVIKLITTFLLIIGSISVLFILNLSIVNGFVEQIDFFCRKLNYNSNTCYNGFREFVMNFDNAFLHFILTPLMQKNISFLFVLQFLSSNYYLLLTIFLIYFSTFTLEIKLTCIIYILSLGLLSGLVFINDGLLTRQKFTIIYPLLCFLYIKTDIKKIGFLYNILNKLKIINLANKESVYKN